MDEVGRSTAVLLTPVSISLYRSGVFNDVAADRVATDVRAICDELSAALGWRIDYMPSTAVAPPNSTAFFPTNDAPDGQIHVRQALSATPRTDRALAVATASAVSQLLQQLHVTQADRDSRAREVSTLLTLSRSDTRQGTLTAALDELVVAAAELTGFWGAAFFLIDPTQQALRLRNVARVDAAKIPARLRALDAATPDAQALLQGAVLLDRDDADAAAWIPEECAFAMAVPVRCNAGPLGTLWCFERRRWPIRKTSVQALQTVAAQIARTLERSVLQRDSARRNRLHQEVRIASQQQARSRRRQEISNPAFDIALRTASASELSGDLCEIIPHDAAKTFFALGDAVGHSIPAAMVMAVARGATRALWEQAPAGNWQPEVLLCQINRTLCSATAAEQFMSLITGILDANEGTLTYANAGHPPPWLVRRGERIALKSHGMLCGVLPQAVYQQSVVPLEPDDLLVFFTDGITDALSSGRQLLRADGVLDALGAAKWSNADDAATAIWQRLQSHTGSSTPTDDQTLIVVQVRRPSAG